MYKYEIEYTYVNYSLNREASQIIEAKSIKKALKIMKNHLNRWYGYAEKYRITSIKEIQQL